MIRKIQSLVYLLLVATLLICSFYNVTYAQMIGGEIFLKGNTVEVGVSSTFAYGTCSVPAGFHDRPGGRLGFVADPGGDGWDVGTPTYIGDYFTPGTPHEGWDIMIDGQWNRAWGACGTYATASGPLELEGENISYTIDGRNKRALWKGTMGDLSITQTTILDTTKTFFVIEVVLKNTGTTSLEDIYYDRTVDPDNEQAVPEAATGIFGGDFTTTNTIVYQPTDEDMTCLVTGVGLVFPEMSYLGLGAKDCRAKAYVLNGGLSPWEDIESIYKDSTPYHTDSGDIVESDVGIGLIFQIGDLEPGDSTSFAYAYILKEADLDSAFAVLQAGWQVDGAIMDPNDTIEVCRGKTLEININGGGAYVWGDWTPTEGLAYPSGRHNFITVQNEVITYRVIGTTTICPQSDTLTLTIIPLGDTTVLNEEICDGQVFHFNDEIVYEEGTYYQVYSTSLEGCDSVIELNLKVNPLPNVDIKVDNNNICDGDNALFQVEPSPNTTYQWLRDGIAISGATQSSYVAPSIGGVYRVVGTTDKGCVDTSRGITLTINPNAIVEINAIEIANFCIGDTVALSVDARTGYEYYWSPEKSFRYTTGARHPNVSGVLYEEVNTMEVMAVNDYGCKAYDQLTIYAKPCCDVYVPTGFSPNGDGVNDDFNILLQPGQKILSFQIFDRSGTMVYDNNDVNKGWNGQVLNTGSEVAQAVYFYRIVYSCTDGENYEAKGDITIVR